MAAAHIPYAWPSARWLWLIVLLTMGVMIGTQTYLIEEEHAQLLARSAESQRNLVDSVARGLEATLEKADLLSQRLADDMASTPERVTQDAYQENLRATISKHRDFDAALMIRPDGFALSSTISLKSPPPNFADRAYFQYHQTHADTGLRIGHPVISKMSGQRIIPLTRRANRSDGSFAGVVVVSLAVDILHNEFIRYRQPDDAFLALAHLDGTVLVRDPHLDSAVATNIRNSSQFQNHYLKQTSGDFPDTSPFDHVVRRYYFRNFSGYPLFVVEGVNEQRLLDETLPALHIKVILMAMMSAVVAALTYYLIRLLNTARGAESEARRALAKVHAFQSALDDYVIVALLDAEGRVIDANDRFCNLSSFTREELVGRLLPPLDGRIHDPEFASTLRHVFSSRQIWRGHRLAHSKHGVAFWLQSCILPIAGSPGERPTFLLAQTDITAVKNAQEQAAEINEALTQTLALNMAILNSTQCGIFATDPQGVIVLFNAAAEALLDYQRQDVVHHWTPLRFFEADCVQTALMADDADAQLDLRPYPECTPTLGQTKSTEWQWRRRDGTALQVSVTTMPILDIHKHVRGYVTVFDDLTEKKKLEVMKSDFVSVVSHELRTPLTSIKGSLSLLKSTLASTLDAGKMRLLDIGVDNCDKLVGLVSDILDIDKLSRGQMSLQRLPQSLVPVVERALTMNAPYAAQLNVRYEFSPPERIGLVSIDAERILQVLTNLLSNAAKFSSAGQAVTIFIEQDDKQVTVGVRDHGAGIPEDFKDKIFERFTQSGSVNTRSKPGSGLGLTIAKSLVELHGGTIRFESKEGAGTTFYIHLPRAVSQEVLAQGTDLVS